jgi:hypothetical protein
MQRFHRRFQLPRIALVWTALSGSLAACALVAPAAAQTLYQTGFEPPTFTAGQPIDGQSSWLAFASPSAGVVSTTTPASGAQDLQINGADVNYFAADSLYEASYGPNILFDGSKTSDLFVQADVKLSGPTTPGDFISANLDVYNSETSVAEMYVSSQGVLYSDNNFGNYAAVAPPITLGKYYTLDMDLDFATQTDKFYEDGVYVDSLPMPTSAVYDREIVAGTAVYGLDDSYGYDHTQYAAYFDNLSVSEAPEPPAISVFVLMGLGVIHLILRARRRTRPLQ